MTQENVFLEGEGDRWFLRNRSALLDENRLEHDPILKLLDIVGLIPRDVLEVGASNGFRLHAIHSRFDCQVTAIEPSICAIEDGKARYANVKFLRGNASDMPIEDDSLFDLVILNFVFNWVDRSMLLRSVAEIDRVLQDGGYLVIGDFHPAYPVRVSYHHLPEASVWTYKQTYADIFLASNLYYLVASVPVGGKSIQFDSNVDASNRGQIVLLHKSFNEHYQTTHFRPVGE